MAEFIYIGTIINHKGYKGELILSDIPIGIKSITQNSKCKIGFSEKFSNYYQINNFKKNGKKAEIILNNINSDKDAQIFKNKGVFLEEENIIYDKITTEKVIGCSVFNIANDELIGLIVDIYYLPSNDVWIVETNRGDLSIPVIDDVVKITNFNKKIVKINVIAGLMDLITK